MGAVVRVLAMLPFLALTLALVIVSMPLDFLAMFSLSTCAQILAAGATTPGRWGRACAETVKIIHHHLRLRAGRCPRCGRYDVLPE